MNGLTQQHRAQQLLLRRATIAHVARLWPALDWAQLDRTYPDFALNVAALVQRNRETSAGLAAEYLQAFRRAQGVPGSLKVVFAEPLIVEQFSTSLRVTSVVAIKRAVTAGRLSDAAMSNALVQTAGSMSRLVLDSGRDTIVGTVRQDARAFGWQRVLGGAGCEFCRMLADRGAVYKEDTADFESHDRCGCTSEPVYDS